MFNKEKFEFAKDVVEFAGFEITKDGFRPPARIIEAIKNFPKPEKVTDIRSWFGLVNQVAYTFSQAEIMEPLREQLSGKKRVWSWNETSQKKLLSHKFERGCITSVSTEPHASPQTGQRRESDSHFLKNTVNAEVQQILDVAKVTGSLCM